MASPKEVMITEEDRQLAIHQLREQAALAETDGRGELRARQLRQLADRAEAGEDPLLGLRQWAALAGVQENTTGQWVERNRKGTQFPPLPDPDPDSFDRRQVWRLSQLIAYLKEPEARRWPPNRAARTDRRRSHRSVESAA